MHFEKITDRIKQLKGIKSDKELAAVLNMKTNAFSERKRTGSIPFENICQFAVNEGVSIDWILTGKEIKEYTPPYEHQVFVDRLLYILTFGDLETKALIEGDIVREYRRLQQQLPPAAGEKRG